MNKLFTGALLITSFCSTGAFAQYDQDQGQYGRDRDGRYDRNSRNGRDGRYGRNGMYSPDSVSGLVARVHSDLNRSYEGGWRFNEHDRDRLNHAERQLSQFARGWQRGKFDKGDLDDAIGSIQHVLDKNHMPPRDRAVLDTDVNQLRGMREAYDRHELFDRR